MRRMQEIVVGLVVVMSCVMAPWAHATIWTPTEADLDALAFVAASSSPGTTTTQIPAYVGGNQVSATFPTDCAGSPTGVCVAVWESDILNIIAAVGDTIGIGILNSNANTWDFTFEAFATGGASLGSVTAGIAAGNSADLILASFGSADTIDKIRVTVSDGVALNTGSQDFVANFTVTSVPEASSSLLLGIALCMVGWVTKKKLALGA